MTPLPPEARQVIFPRRDFQPTIYANPRPRAIALHEAHLAYPARPVDKKGQFDPTLDLYQYLNGFAIAPTSLDTSLPSVTWSFQVSAEMAATLPKVAVEPSLGGHTIWGIQSGTKMYQVRCVKNAALRTMAEHRWAVADTAWPEVVFFEINGSQLNVRRKNHYGKDLPLNITPFLVEGENHLRITVLHDTASRPGRKVPSYSAAVELIDTADRKRILDMVRTMPANVALAGITKRLAGSSATGTGTSKSGVTTGADDDDDVCLVDDDITIDLCDPWTSRLFVTPARSTACSHLECFDLDTFLETRLMTVGLKGPTEKMAEGEGMPEEWKCPICGQDARPRSLMIDGFLLEVRQTLAAQNKLDARAVRVKKDGSWESRMDISVSTRREKQSDCAAIKAGPQSGPHASVTKEEQAETASTAPRSQSEPEVIELD
ncbi:hypothetical protein KEM52_000516 [Ascosphaera acerosa]|nr:hypothetical protein KEM52_000516 [Ascosphaera acerosa]